MEESCIPSNIQWITHFLTNPKMTNQNTIGSGICSVKAWTTIIWYLCRLVYPREISQATMMAGSSRWQSAVVGGNGAWRSRMRTMNPKSNRTCLYRRSDRGPVLVLSKASAKSGRSLQLNAARRINPRESITYGMLQEIRLLDLHIKTKNAFCKYSGLQHRLQHSFKYTATTASEQHPARVCSRWRWNGVGREIPKPNQPIVRRTVCYHANYYCDKA